MNRLYLVKLLYNFEKYANKDIVIITDHLDTKTVHYVLDTLHLLLLHLLEIPEEELSYQVIELIQNPNIIILHLLLG